MFHGVLRPTLPDSDRSHLNENVARRSSLRYFFLAVQVFVFSLVLVLCLVH